jgi:putative ABC transport system substrate-binding protein
MKRREFITLLGGAAVAWPVAARAQQGERVRRIGVAMGNRERDGSMGPNLAAFREAFRDLGWIEGRNVATTYRYADGDLQRMRANAAEMVALKPDVIVAQGTQVVAALRRETSTIPVVVVQASDPVGTGLVGNVAQPGGNITGFATFEHSIGGKWLGLLKEVAPDVERVLVIKHPENPATAAYMRSIETVASSLKVRIAPGGQRSATEIERAIDSFAREPNGGLILPPDPLSLSNREFIIALAARHRLPAVYPYRAFAAAGGLMSYGIDLADNYRRAAGYVDRILKGSKPAELPVQLPTKFELIVNLRTAKELGLNIPESFLLNAHEIIE